VGFYEDRFGHMFGLLVGTRAVLSSLRVSPRLRVRYHLNIPARVTITIRRVLPGRLSKGRCAAPSGKNRTHQRCTRLVPIRGGLTESGTPGSDRFTFDGRIGGHKLGPGSYRLIATPSFGTAQTVAFRIPGVP
jgi:hypothetical protein